MLFLFSANSDFIFGKNAPCQLLRLNFKNKSDFFNYDLSFKLSAITRFCSSRFALSELNPAYLSILYAAQYFVLLELSFAILHTKYN